ncbi:MAG: hypothetical protein BRD45_00135 [Bacteroidetes bacterium QS_8_64_10]|nr:MAG: hypothetical protein BRD45_00135 [Bacteroidetes bacterium QS_8_64_10]
MPDDADAPTQTENDDPGDDRPRSTPAHTAVQALRAMLGPPPDSSDEEPGDNEPCDNEPGEDADPDPPS